MVGFPKFLLGIEVLVAFVPYLIFLVYVGMFGPWYLVACGFAGLFAIASMWSWITGDRNGVLSPVAVWIGIALGFMPLAPFLANGQMQALYFAVVPSLVAMHFVYLARDYLFLGASKKNRNTEGRD